MTVEGVIDMNNYECPVCSGIGVVGKGKCTIDGKRLLTYRIVPCPKCCPEISRPKLQADLSIEEVRELELVT